MSIIFKLAALAALLGCSLAPASTFFALSSFSLAPASTFFTLSSLSQLSALIVPAIVCLCGVLMLWRRDLFASFLRGAKNGLECAIGLLPTLTALLVAVGMLNASGAVELFGRLLAPLCSRLGIPEGLLPLLLTRPVSGSASTAVFSDLLIRYGADSLEAFCASVIMGSSDTLIYVLSVYFSSAGVRRTRYAFPVAFGVMIFSVLFCCAVGRIFWTG